MKKFSVDTLLYKEPKNIIIFKEVDYMKNLRTQYNTRQKVLLIFSIAVFLSLLFTIINGMIFPITATIWAIVAIYCLYKDCTKEKELSIKVIQVMQILIVLTVIIIMWTQII